MPTSRPWDRSSRPLLNRTGLVVLWVTLGAAWRLALGTRYAGWEESDYGNLAMVRGVLEGGFQHYDMNHMPGYYALAAAALAALGDTVLAARLVSLLGGLVALGLSVALADRVFGRGVALLTGLVLVVQPEFALYAASSLREPVYAAFTLACLWALVSERPVWAGAFAAGAFFVRFDAALALGPLLAVHALGRPPRPRRLLKALAPLGAAVGLWSLYTSIDHGTAAFWSHAVAVNVETGLGAEASTGGAWWAAGLGVAARLLCWLLPWRIGWGLWLGLGVALVTTPWWRAGPHRTWSLLGVLLAGVWAGIGLVGQHDPGHNLYWKWMMPLVPVLVPLGLAGLLQVGARASAALGRVAGVALIGLLVAQGLASNLRETHRQVSLSEQLYRPQLELGRWIEEAVPEDQPLLVDNIPACWINRRPHERELVSWFDVPTTPGSPEAFAQWVAKQDIAWVLWFEEDWTQAPAIAPFLADGGVWTQDGAVLTEVAREDDYGWILYRVEGAGQGAPPTDLRGP